MALTVGVVKPLTPGTPTRRFVVPLILDGSSLTAAGLAHGVPGTPPGAPDSITPALGGTTAVYISNAVPTSTALGTQLDVTISGSGSAAETLFVELEWLSAF
jgi:hypothetical protein